MTKSRSRRPRLLGQMRQWYGLLARDPMRWPAMPGELRWYFGNLRRFKALQRAASIDTEIELHPVLFQRTPAMPFDAHYVYQAAWATRKILDIKPETHVDISSNIPFIAQLSVLVPTRYVEFNPPKLTLPGLRIERGDVVNLPFDDRSVASLSCLHVIEHIGLGRYGDPLDAEGTEKACRELARCVADGGSLLISLPIGKRRVQYNAHRILDPRDVVSYMPELELLEFSVVTDEGTLVENVRPADYADLSYGCGLYRFTRKPRTDSGS